MEKSTLSIIVLNSVSNAIHGWNSAANSAPRAHPANNDKYTSLVSSASALKEMQIKKLPDLAALRKEYRSLNDRKTKLYEDYRQAKKQMQEYGVVKKNVDSILYPSQSRAREQER
ncbi:MAG: hypothetical protein ACLRID_11035 [Subdoligranulum sp.]